MSSVAIKGYAVSGPDDLMKLEGDRFVSLARAADPLPRKTKRFACRAGAEAISACERAFSMAGLDPQHLGERFGLYTSQAGQQHSDIDDYDVAMERWHQQADEESLLKYLWNSRDVNPFLAIKGLSNNLLGIISVLWSLRGDCCAFVRDEVGAASALSEAIFNIQQGYIDTALVVSAGTTCDFIEQAVLNNDDQRVGYGAAVALVLQRSDAMNQQATLTNFKLSYSNPTYPQLSDNFLLDQLLEKGYFFPKSEPRWGGVMLSIVWMIHMYQNSEIDQAHTVNIFNKNSSGFSVSTSLGLIN